MNIPNFLTLIRIVLIPLLIIAFYLPGNFGNYTAASIFAIAAFTDWLDGFLARVLGQQSKLGKFLDPVADKLIVSVALVLLSSRYNSFLFVIPACAIICREILVSALREWMSEMGKRTSVAVSFVGKVKTVVQMLAIFIFLLISPLSPNSYLIAGYLVIYLAVILTIWSMVNYLKASWDELKAS